MGFGFPDGGAGGVADMWTWLCVLGWGLGVRLE